MNSILTSVNTKIEATAEAVVDAVLNQQKPKAVNEDIIAAAPASSAMPSKSAISENQNLIVAIIGGAAAVALEVLSPTGSKTSAIVAGVAAAGVTYYCKDVINLAPQNTTLAVTTGLVTGYVGMCAGRIAACYFPGNIED